MTIRVTNELTVLAGAVERAGGDRAAAERSGHEFTQTLRAKLRTAEAARERRAEDVDPGAPVSPGTATAPAAEQPAAVESSEAQHRAGEQQGQDDAAPAAPGIPAAGESGEPMAGTVDPSVAQMIALAQSQQAGVHQAIVEATQDGRAQALEEPIAPAGPASAPVVTGPAVPGLGLPPNAQAAAEQAGLPVAPGAGTTPLTGDLPTAPAVGSAPTGTAPATGALPGGGEPALGRALPDEAVTDAAARAAGTQPTGPNVPTDPADPAGPTGAVTGQPVVPTDGNRTGTPGTPTTPAAAAPNQPAPAVPGTEQTSSGPVVAPITPGVVPTPLSSTTSGTGADPATPDRAAAPAPEARPPVTIADVIAAPTPSSTPSTSSPTPVPPSTPGADNTSTVARQPEQPPVPISTLASAHNTAGDMATRAAVAMPQQMVQTALSSASGSSTPAVSASTETAAPARTTATSQTQATPPAAAAAQAAQQPHAPAVTPASSSAPAQAAAPPPPIHSQILAAMTPALQRRDGSYNVHLQLDPVSLGRVSVTVTMQAGEISVQMQASDASSRDMLRQSSDQLRDQLAGSGFSGANVDVGDGSPNAWQDPRAGQGGYDVPRSGLAYAADDLMTDEPALPGALSTGRAAAEGALDLKL